MSEDPRALRLKVLPFLSPFFLGVAPLFGKLAYRAGADPFTVAASRTVIAALILWALYLIFWRQYIYIYPAGLLGCVVVGTVNGIGSLMYYAGLNLLDASLAQLLNGMYIVFAALLVRFGGQQITWRTKLRITLTLLALILLTGAGLGGVNWLGVGLMLGNALMFAGTVVLSQRVLFEMPARTVTLYSISTMAVVVTMMRMGYGLYATAREVDTVGALGPIVALAISTALARLTMFIGVKKLGSLQTALINMMEIGVALLLAFAFLGERLTSIQWVGVGFLVASILLMRHEENPKGVQPDATPLPTMAGITLFQQMAFDAAFRNGQGSLKPEELEAIRRMMGMSADRPPPSVPQAGEKLPTSPQSLEEQSAEAAQPAAEVTTDPGADHPQSD